MQNQEPTQSQATIPSVQGDPDLKEYADACDKAIGESVKQFSCNDGYELPMKSEDDKEGGSCEKPPYLPRAGCYKYSRIGQQPTSENVSIVFLCRHKSIADQNSHLYEDVAVIQTNIENGATCFYQQINNKKPVIDGKNVPAPKTGEFWMSPKEIALPRNACAQCHDSGPFLRTPYVMQQKANISAFTKDRNDKNYWFPGDKFLGWNGKIFQAKFSDKKKCSGSCHTMGANAIDPTVGTSSWLAPYSTGEIPIPLLDGEHGDTAFWMRLNLTKPNKASQEASKILSECAQQQGNVPNCTLTPWGKQLEAINEELQKNPTSWHKMLEGVHSNIK